jgi:hypothetical protein
MEDNISLSDDFRILAAFRPEITEIINLGDELTSSMDILIEDELALKEYTELAHEPCYSACGYGGPVDPISGVCALFYGSRTHHNFRGNEFFEMSDVLTISSSNVLSENLNFTDQLCISDGYGCPSGLGDGYGITAYGC